MAGSGCRGRRDPACPRALPGGTPAVYVTPWVRRGVPGWRRPSLAGTGGPRGSQVRRGPGRGERRGAFPRALVLKYSPSLARALTLRPARLDASKCREERPLLAAALSGPARWRESLCVPQKSHRAACCRLPKWVTSFSIGSFKEPENIAS